MVDDLYPVMAGGIVYGFSRTPPKKDSMATPTQATRAAHALEDLHRWALKGGMDERHAADDFHDVKSVLPEVTTPVQTYKIIRFYADDRPAKTVQTGLTKEAAQAHCRNEATHGPGWFDGYDEEK